MATPRSRQAARLRARRRRAQQRARRLAVLGIVAALALVTLAPDRLRLGLARRSRDVPSPPPRSRRPERAARARGARHRRQPPDPASRSPPRTVTAIGFHGARRRTRSSCSPSGGRSTRGSWPGSGAGSPARRSTGPVWYQLEGGPGTEVLDVGAMPGTDVYAPVDGTVVVDLRLRDRRQGVRLAHRHAADARRPSVIVSLTHVRARPVARGRDRPSLAGVVEARAPSSTSPRSSGRRSPSARARRGNNVAIEVHPAAGSLP